MIAILLNQIVEAGMTEAEIAKVIGCNQSSVNRMRHGKQRCGYEIGTRIERLHSEKVGAPPPAQPHEGRAAA